MSLPDNQTFLKLLTASGIADEASLSLATQQAAEATDVRELAVRLVRSDILTNWQAKFLLSGRHRLKIGKYTLQERLDRAAFGDRFVAIHQALDRKVELQLLKSALNGSQLLFDSFLQQAQKSAQLDHPHLMHVYDIDQEADRFYLVVEHLDGRSMDDDVAVSQVNVSEMAMHLSPAEP